MKNQKQKLMIALVVFWALVPDIFAFSHAPYEASHSVVTFFAVFFAVWIITKRPHLPMLAWLVHILIDFFSNTTNFYSIHLFYPLTDYRFGESLVSLQPALLVLSYISAFALAGYFIWQYKLESKNYKLNK